MSYFLQLNQLISTEPYQTNVEEIHEEDVILALNVLNFLKYEDTADFFLGCSAANMLNAYVRQRNRKIDHAFKIHLNRIIQAIYDHHASRVKIGVENGNSRTLIFQFKGFQFSFQSRKIPSYVKQHDKKMIWDGVRKQACSKTIFYKALENEALTNLTLGDNDFKQFLEEELVDYRKGYYKFKDNKLIKHGHLKRNDEIDDPYLKNYLRIYFRDYQNKPVILKGVFENIGGQHVTFKNIIPYIKKTKTAAICDHINLYRPTVEKHIDSEQLKKGQQYYIIGYCKRYGREYRMGVELDEDLTHSPILEMSDFRKITIDTFEKCASFSVEEHLSDKQKSFVF